MDLTGQLVIACLEEDDTRRVLFRIRPLLTQSGVISQEDLLAYGQEGWLRIAPDKQEQFTFKERMQSLGTLCLINLQDPAIALHKVRPNKNFAPSRGEVNRYIIYSDAVQELPRDLMYEVLTEDKAAFSLTAQYYLRSGGRITGPHCPSNAQVCPASHTLQPDNEGLHLVDIPGLGSRMFYWPLSQQAAVFNQKETDFTDNQIQVTAASNPTEAESQHSIPPKTASRWQTAAGHFWQALSAAGFAISLQEASCLLLLCATQAKLQINGDCLADAHLAARLIAGFLPLGWAGVDDNQPAAEDEQLQLVCQGGAGINQGMEHYYIKPWPAIHLPSKAGIPAAFDVPRLTTLKGLLEELQELSDTDNWDEGPLSASLQHLAQHQFALPLVVRMQIAQFLSSYESLYPGNQELANTYALTAWALPWLMAAGASAGEAEGLMTQ